MISKDGVLYVRIIRGGNLDGPEFRYPQPLYFHFAQWVSATGSFSSQTAGHITTFSFSLLGLIVLYVLANCLGGPVLARWSALLYAIHPELVLMDSDVSNMSCALFFSLLGLGALWLSLRYDSVPCMILTPILSILAALSRREAVALGPVILGIPCILFAISSQPRFRNWLIPSLRYLLIAGSTVAICLIISGTMFPSFNFRIYKTGLDVVEFTGLLYDPWERVAWAGIKDFVSDFLEAVFWSLIPFVGLGFFCRKQGRNDTMLFSILVSFLASTMAINLGRAYSLGPTYVSTRYFLLAAPAILMLASAGVLLALKNISRYRRSLALICALLVLVPCLSYDLFPPLSREEPYRQAANFILNSYGPGHRIGSTRSQIAYYAQGHHVPLSGAIQDLDPEKAEYFVLRVQDDEAAINELLKKGRMIRIKEFNGRVWLLQGKHKR
jgi:hypothetical protein